PVEAPVLLPARREIGDLDRPIVAISQHRAQDGGVPVVRLLRRGESFQLDVPEPAVLPRLQQRAKGRIAIEGRQAAPHQPRARIEQHAEAAVADQAQLEVLRCPAVRRLAFDGTGHQSTSWLPCMSSRTPSHARTAAGSRRWKLAALGLRSPTSTLIPSRALTCSKPLSSVKSSPAKTGVRPRYGGTSSSAAIACPLSRPPSPSPPGYSSATCLPCWSR